VLEHVVTRVDAFWALCGVFAAVVAAQLWLFRRRGWFGR
jgi:hypothetical protein